MVDDRTTALLDHSEMSALPSHLQRPRLRRRDAADYLQTVHGISVAPTTLAKLASIGGGPAFQKAGRYPYYPREELDSWAISRLGRMQRSTADVERPR